MSKTTRPRHAASVRVRQGSFVQVTTQAGDSFLICRMETSHRDGDIPAVTRFVEEVLTLGGVADLIGLTAKEPA